MLAFGWAPEEERAEAAASSERQSGRQSGAGKDRAGRDRSGGGGGGDGDAERRVGGGLVEQAPCHRGSVGGGGSSDEAEGSGGASRLRLWVTVLRGLHARTWVLSLEGAIVSQLEVPEMTREDQR